MFNMHPSRITRRPQARTEATKAKILDAAQSLFAELGFENTQLDEVAARAGWSIVFPQPSEQRAKRSKKSPI
jgi:AcrR family transcriptional regulator